jgi:hypothetical protein
MARKKAPKVTTTKTRAGIAVRLELKQDDFDRLQRRADAIGLTKASYARMAVMERIKADEEKERGK